MKMLLLLKIHNKYYCYLYVTANEVRQSSNKIKRNIILNPFNNNYFLKLSIKAIQTRATHSNSELPCGLLR